MEQVLYQLPDGWAWKRLSELAKTTSGGTPSRSNKDYWGGTIPWVKSGELGDSRVERNEEFITELGLKNSSAKLFPKESLLIALYGATAGKLGILAYPAATNQAVCCISPDDKLLERDFLRYYLLSQRKKIIEDSFGGAQPNISQAYVRDIKIPTPPIVEQKRLTEKLDALLNRIDTAIENLQESITLADALLKSSLNSMLTPRENWEWVRMNDVCQITSKLCDPREEQYLDMFHIGGANITQFSGSLINVKTAREEQLISGKFPFDTSMVLYSKIRPYLMKVARPMISGICSADIYPLTPVREKMTRDFLFYLLLSEQFTQYAIEGSSRAGMPKVNRNHLFNFAFHLPSLDEQVSICESLDALVEKTNEASIELEGKLVYLTSLKASILDSAFKGEF
ncbi:restriction endonuclease subunit S [Enterobacter cloacae subsp. cloacae]|uniref:restriction endonuclease subunit S n=1 Tax=Enterobacterales TaxID=91347 RepID=UPI0021CFEB23|nr:restriction endonuclease subunit S [Enterobacter cloacae]EKU6674374.1 restriction endonuclease subunit S [Klebsiella aerogenes]MCU6311081.1 restriction endonuclease subunit S [Enterobacter cloacae]WLD34346.1 restriction endonuclease subunit S [Enterobacter cloacae subsp. cloacae]